MAVLSGIWTSESFEKTTSKLSSGNGSGPGATTLNSTRSLQLPLTSGTSSSTQAVDLSVAQRLSQEASATVSVRAGGSFGRDFTWRPELEFGYREIMTGGPGDTTAKFVSGNTSFTLAPQLQDRGGLLARLGLRAGGQFADFSADAGGVFNKDYQTYDARAVARFLF